MKNLTLTLILFLTLITFSSCNEDESNLKSANESAILIINEEDVPDVIKYSATYDNTRETSLNIETGVLKVPVFFTKDEMKRNKTESISAKWRIATRKSGCKSGVGFRCGNDLPPAPLKNSDSDKSLQATIVRDYEKGYINFQFDNNIDWGNF